MPILLMSIQTPENRDILTELYEKYSRFMFRVAFNITNNESDAEDAVQDVFVKLMETPGYLYKLPPEEQKGFLLVCVKNRALDIVRARKLLCGEEWDEALVINKPAGRISGDDEITFLKEEMKKLPLQQQSVLILHYYFGFRFHEIGKLLGISMVAAQKAAHRAKKALRDVMRG